MHPKLITSKKFARFQELLEELKEEYGINSGELLNTTDQLSIPVSLFSSRLSALELITKYLVENCRMSLSRAGEATGRSRQSMYQAYADACRKHPEPFDVLQSVFTIPLFVVKEREYAVLESIVVYLREHHQLSFADIASLLRRDPRTVWTTYQRTRKR